MIPSIDPNKALPVDRGRQKQNDDVAAFDFGDLIRRGDAGDQDAPSHYDTDDRAGAVSRVDDRLPPNPGVSAAGSDAAAFIQSAQSVQLPAAATGFNATQEDADIPFRVSGETSVSLVHILTGPAPAFAPAVAADVPLGLGAEADLGAPDQLPVARRFNEFGWFDVRGGGSADDVAADVPNDPLAIADGAATASVGRPGRIDPVRQGGGGFSIAEPINTTGPAIEAATSRAASVPVGSVATPQLTIPPAEVSKPLLDVDAIEPGARTSLPRLAIRLLPRSASPVAVALAELDHGIGVAVRAAALDEGERQRLRDAIDGMLARHGYLLARLTLAAPRPTGKI